MKNILVVLVFLVLGANAHSAGKANNFYVQSVRVDKSGLGFVVFDQDLVDNPAACGSGYPRHLSFDTSTNGGKSIFSLVLTAKALNKKVIAYGTGNCTHYTNVVEAWTRGWINE